MMKKLDTKTRVLNAAEQLFAAHGFNNTSLRQITSEANVNLASVNYHFGSKKSLIQAVLARYLQVFMPQLTVKINQLDERSIDGRQLSLDDLLEAFVEPLLALNRISAQGARNFMVMIGRGYAETQGHLRRYISEHYGQQLSHIVSLFAKVLPGMSKADLFWRLHFSLGALVFMMTSGTALAEISEADFAEVTTTEHIVNKLIPFIAAGLTN